MSLRKVAEELLTMADEIEKVATETAQFVCAECNHTSTLSKINEKRIQAAEKVKTSGQEVIVSEITINDKVACPACDGIMAYKVTEASSKFYFDPEKTAKEVETEDDDGKAKEASEPVNYDSSK